MLMAPHSQWAPPSCRVGAVAPGPGMARFDFVDACFGLGWAVSDPDARRPVPVASGLRALTCTVRFTSPHRGALPPQCG